MSLVTSIALYLVWYPPSNVDNFEIAIIALAGTKFTLSTIGSRWKRMLFTHPPVYSISYWMECPADCKLCKLKWQEYFDRRTLRIESGYGLTIGDLFEAATSLLEDHRECLESISGTSEGTFKQRVYFGTPCPRIRVESPIPNPKYSSP